MWSGAFGFLVDLAFWDVLGRFRLRAFWGVSVRFKAFGVVFGWGVTLLARSAAGMIAHMYTHIYIYIYIYIYTYIYIYICVHLCEGSQTIPALDGAFEHICSSYPAHLGCVSGDFL